MKRVMLLVALMATSFVVLAQSDNGLDEKRSTYGFNLGINYARLLADNLLPDYATAKSNPGFRLGILAEYKITKHFYFTPKAELSFNGTNVVFSNTDGTNTNYEVMPVSVDLMAHLTFKKNDGKINPYFFIGPDFKQPIAKKSASSSEYPSGPDFAIDMGLGVDKSFAHFIFSPELRYSYGLLNVNANPVIQTLKFHNISLVFNFKG